MRVAFIGTGQMATALGCGFAPNGVTITGYDLSEAARDRFSERTGGTASNSVAAACDGVDAIFLAVKPAAIPQVAQAVSAAGGDALVVSIAAGVSLETLESGLPGRRVIRVMPNTPVMVDAGACAFARGSLATNADVQALSQLLAHSGTADEVPESLLDAVTGLSGSGPAYVYQIIEALSDGGVRQGLPRPLATKLAAQTVLGAAEMVMRTGRHPGELKDAVTSPGGTTIAGLHALERGGLRATLMNAVEAATKRSEELR